MDVSHIIDPLNDAQRLAVTAQAAPALVLAGAGSGKTRVLTHRIGWLVVAEGCSPQEVLAVTFTNKAAREMRGRIEELLQLPTGGMWIGTFHGLCHRLLRMHFDDAGLPQTFEIIDSDDQYRLVRRILNELDLDEAYWPPRQMQWMINQHKEEARRASQLPTGEDYQQQTLYRVYASYEETCQRLGLVDFAEILLRALELFRNNQSVRETWQKRFKHVLVDEFQDTNTIQYQWLRILTADNKFLFAVGDDDQSIYGWRGAKVENLLTFEKDFEGAQIIRLEQNYRSSGHILAAANAVIEKNDGRMGKELWTEAADGNLIRLYGASNEIDEAQYVVSTIESWVQEGNRRGSIAILYRSNAQSRAFEEQLLNAGMPYRVYGGLRFFERAEIKDALAYMRLVSNRESDPSFERIVNLPPRGIGAKTLEQVRDHSRAKQLSMWQAAAEVIAEEQLSVRAAGALGRFIELIEEISEATDDQSLESIADKVLQMSGLLDHYKKDKSEKAQGRVENLEELVTAANNFVPAETEDGDLDPLSLFLANAALEAGEGQAAEWEDCVQLMSLHTAKGLEFPLVFLCGLEEGLFPHQRSLEEAGRLEEERRLCYVGMTRAMEQLYLCYAEIRRLYGKDNYTQASRFLSEIPIDYIEEIRSSSISRPLHRPNRPSASSATNSNSASNGLQPGTQVNHAKFGEGMVVMIEGQGDNTRVQINFSDSGLKWILPAYAKLEIL